MIGSLVERHGIEPRDTFWRFLLPNHRSGSLNRSIRRVKPAYHPAARAVSIIKPAHPSAMMLVISQPIRVIHSMTVTSRVKERWSNGVEDHADRSLCDIRDRASLAACAQRPLRVMTTISSGTAPE